jgi:hypothetical protein
MWSSPGMERLDGNGVKVTIWSMSDVPSRPAGIGHHAMRLSCFNPQFFLASKVGDTALEDESAAIIRRSRQEMQIVIDALRALAAALPTEQMPPGDRRAVDRLQGLAQQIDQAGRRGYEVASFSPAEVDELIRRLRRLRLDDPESADRILQRLTEEAAPTPAPQE